MSRGKKRTERLPVSSLAIQLQIVFTPCVWSAAPPSSNAPLCCEAKEPHRKEGEGHLPVLPSYPCSADGTGRMIFDSHLAARRRSPH